MSETFGPMSLSSESDSSRLRRCNENGLGKLVPAARVESDRERDRCLDRLRLS